MRILGKSGPEKLQKALQIKYRYISCAVFQYLCVNEELLENERYKELFNELYELFLALARTTEDYENYSGEDIVAMARREYKKSGNFVEQIDKRYIDNYLLDYPNKKHLLTK